MLTPAVTNRLIAEWLARAHPVPAQAWAEWENQDVALLPLGGLFTAFRLPGRIVHAALCRDAPDEVSRALQQWLRGPVIHDHRSTGATYYALTNWGAGVIHQLDQDPDVPCLGLGTYLGVPRVDRQEPPGTYWVVPPRYDGDLCRPAAVRSLITAGRRELTLRSIA